MARSSTRRSTKPSREVPLRLSAPFAAAHETTGSARLVGSEVQLIDLDTDPGPDLRVYLTRKPYRGGDVGEHLDLGPLKGNKGTQRYLLEDGGGAYASVVIWCRAFSVAFGSPISSTGEFTDS